MLFANQLLEFRDGHRLPIRTNRYIDNFRFSNSYAFPAFSPPFGFDQHFYGDRCSTGFGNGCVKTDDIANEDRRNKYHFVQCNSDNLCAGYFSCLNRSGCVDIAENYTAKYCSSAVCVSRHHCDANGWLAEIGNITHTERLLLNQSTGLCSWA